MTLEIFHTQSPMPHVLFIVAVRTPNNFIIPNLRWKNESFLSNAGEKLPEAKFHPRLKRLYKGKNFLAF